MAVDNKKVGNSQEIILDTTLMEMAHLKVDDELNVTVHDSGLIALTPLKPVISGEVAANATQRIIHKNADLFQRLS